MNLEIGNIVTGRAPNNDYLAKLIGINQNTKVYTFVLLTDFCHISSNKQYTKGHVWTASINYLNLVNSVKLVAIDDKNRTIEELILISKILDI